MEFIEINVRDNPVFVRQRLFGDRIEAEESGSAPGESGLDSQAILYLSGVDGLDQSLDHEVHRLVNSRRYVDALGHRWQVADSVWIIAALQTDQRTTAVQRIALGHWICTSFRHLFQINMCDDADVFWIACRSIALELGHDLDGTVSERLYRVAKKTPERLHAVRRWITNACAALHVGVNVEVTGIERQMLSDIGTVLAGLPYRQQHIAPEAFAKWADQFGERSAIAFHIVRCIAERYYIGGPEYFRAIGEIIRQFEIPAKASVIFCKWQAEGRSAPRVAHEMKNQANWRIHDRCEIDLQRRPMVSGDVDPAAEQLIVLVDDFAGSGRTLGKLFEGTGAAVPFLLRQLPRARLFVGVIAGYRDAFQRVIKSTEEYGERVKIVPYRVFEEEDKCFSENSRVLADPSEREEFKRFCFEVASRYFGGLGSKHRLGFNGTGSLVVFADTVPNNTLPIIWYDNSSEWSPLFPASGLPRELGESK